MTLEVEPELGRGPEVPGEPQGRVSTYRPLAAHNAIHTRVVHADIPNMTTLRKLARALEVDPAELVREG